MSAPGGVELDQPGRGRVTDGGLQAAAAQNHQRVLLRVQPSRGSQATGDKAEHHRRFKPEPEHPCRAGRGTQRADRHRTEEFIPKTSSESRGDMRTPLSGTCVYRVAGRTDLSLLNAFREPKQRQPNVVETSE